MAVYENLLMDTENNCIDVIKCSSRNWRAFEAFIQAWYAKYYEVEKLDKKYKPDFIVTSKYDNFFVECKQVSTFPLSDCKLELVQYILKWMDRYRSGKQRQAQRIMKLCQTQNVKFAFHCKTNSIAFIVDLDINGNIKWKNN